jgi:hypothetical protein
VNAMSDHVCTICGEPLPPGEEMFKFHGFSGPCPKPPLTTKNGRTVDDAIGEADRLLQEMADELDSNDDRDCWFMARITKVREALADRPLTREQVRAELARRGIDTSPAVERVLDAVRRSRG